MDAGVAERNALTKPFSIWALDCRVCCRAAPFPPAAADNPQSAAVSEVSATWSSSIRSDNERMPPESAG
jgi:hypothetical protein